MNSNKVIKRPRHTTVVSEEKSLWTLGEHIFPHIFSYLNNEDKNNFFTVSKQAMSIVGSPYIIKGFILNVDRHSLGDLIKLPATQEILYQNIVLDFNNVSDSERDGIVKFYLGIKNKSCIKNLTIKNYNYRYGYGQLKQIINESNIKNLVLEKCFITKSSSDEHNIIGEKSWDMISFVCCNDSVFNMFINQKQITKICVTSTAWTWNGFPHEIFNTILKTSCTQEIVFVGAGTGSYFDCDHFPYKIEKLDTDMITFHWYVGIRTSRVSFLESQISYLKDLTIHKLPYDFDGGRVLHYIFDKMNLRNFYYKKTALIKNNEKQKVDEIVDVSEIQIQSLFELVRQFPSITSICLKISATDVASDEIERVINPLTNIFNNIREFELIDNSRYRGICGVFLGLYKNLTNLRKIVFKTEDRNINTILSICLPLMTRLNEIYITTRGARSEDRFKEIRRFVPALRKISVAPQLVSEAKSIFGETVIVKSI